MWCFEKWTAVVSINGVKHAKPAACFLIGVYEEKVNGGGCCPLSQSESFAFN